MEHEHAYRDLDWILGSEVRHPPFDEHGCEGEMMRVRACVPRETYLRWQVPQAGRMHVCVRAVVARCGPPREVCVHVWWRDVARHKVRDGAMRPVTCAVMAR